MKQLLAQARARTVRHLVLDKGSLALTIGMGGLILLLLIGTQVLDWYWPVLLTVVSLGVGLYQLRQHIPSLYQLAQRIDQRMALADSLSTAVYFSEHPVLGLENVCAMQSRGAEQMAMGVNLEQALPFARPRYLYLALALLAVASGLFVARYAVLGSLDLNSSLLKVALDNFFISPVEDEPAKLAKLKLGARGFDPSQPDMPQEENPSIIVPPDAEKGQPLGQKGESPKDGSQGQGENDQQKGKEQGDSSKDSGGDQSKDGKQGGEQGEQGSDGEDEPSMMDKVRDAFENLMNKMGSNEGQQKAGKAGSKSKGQKQDKSNKGEQEKSEAAQGEGQGEANAKSEKGKEARDAQQSNQPGQGEPGTSGAGEEDGKKDIEAAKTLEAMGKVSEMLLKRGDEIKGQVMVEVKSTKQTLRTAMTQQNAGHTDAGGEIHRDQVPLADQLFVERYFQEVRKPAGAAKK